MRIKANKIVKIAAEAIRLYNAGAYDRALPLFQDLVRWRHDLARSLHAVGDCAMNVGKSALAMGAYRRALTIDPRRCGAQENLIFLLDAQPDTTPAIAAAERQRWWAMYGAHAYAGRQPYTPTLDPDKRLRVGYVSGDYRFHSAAIAFSGVITNHSDAIEPVFYSTLPPTLYDDVTKHQWINRVGPYFVDVSQYNAATFAQIVRDDLVDILVDLSGYTACNRLLSFAHKPAPIQISAWGYATGTGMAAMDYLISDPIVASPEIRAGLAETVIDLPCVLTFTPRPDVPPVNALQCLDHPPVFSAFQRSSKLNREVLAVWSEILQRVPESKLLFKGPDYGPLVREWIASQMPDVRHQISFHTATSHLEHQSWYQMVDLSLDPWPQTGGVSTLESIHMGVPPVTLIGDRVIQRTSASVLTVLGHPEFIASTTQEYIDKAVYFVTEGRTHLAQVRSELRPQLLGSPIVVGYVAQVETHYRELWRAFCARQAKEQAA